MHALMLSWADVLQLTHCITLFSLFTRAELDAAQA
jgi:hypothetical protein